MLNIRRSIAAVANPKFTEAPVVKGNNLAWLEHHLPLLADVNRTPLLLLGGKNPVSFRLRVAQSHARDDLTPSHWSHVTILAEPAKELATTETYEISLEPPGGFGYPPVTNAVRIGRLAEYRVTQQFPNIAVVCVPLKRSTVLEHLERFMGQRAVLDALEQVMLWLAFVWGVGRASNPLLEGQGIPAATMVEYVVGAAGYELTPGLASRSSCPEAIWQSARYWQDYYSKENSAVLEGAWRVSHRLGEEVKSLTIS